MDITQNPIIARMAGSLRGFLTAGGGPTQQAGAETAGLADGGGLRYYNGSQDGGRVAGPGNATSDSVPARYSNGEYVLPADTAAQIGHENLDAIRDATHVPAAQQQGLRGGVAMADGGRRRVFGDGTDGPGGLTPYAPNVIGGQQANPALALDLDPVVDQLRAVNLSQPASGGLTPYEKTRMPAMADPAVLAQQTPASPVSDAVQGLRGVFSDGTDGPAPRTVPPFAASPVVQDGTANAIPGSGRGPAYDGSMDGLVNTEAGRNAYAAAQAIPGVSAVAGGLTRGLRAVGGGLAGSAGVVGTTAGVLAPAAAGYGVYKGMQADGEIPEGAAATALARLRTAAGLPPTQAPAPANALGTAGVPPTVPTTTPPVVTAPPVNPNAVTRTGNSYTGGPNISGTPTINGKTPGGGFMSVPGGETSATTWQQDEYARQVASAQATNAGGMAVASSQQAQLDSERARQRAETQASSINGAISRGGRNALKALDARELDTGKNAAHVAGAQATADAALRGHQVAAAGAVQAAALKGRGDLRSASVTAAAKLAEDVGKRQASAKFIADAGGDVTKAAANARAAGRNDIAKEYDETARGTAELGSKATEAGTKALTTSLEAAARKPDGTVDQGAVAQHRATVDRFVAARAADAEKAGDRRGAAAIREAGPAGLGADRVQQILKQQENLDASVKDDAWYNPFSSKGVHSADPAAGQIVGLKKGLLQDEYVMQGGGTRPTRDVDRLGGLRSYLLDPTKNKNLNKVN